MFAKGECCVGTLRVQLRAVTLQSDIGGTRSSQTSLSSAQICNAKSRFDAATLSLNQLVTRLHLFLTTNSQPAVQLSMAIRLHFQW